MQPQADHAVRPGQVRDLPRATRGGTRRRRAGGARACRDQGLHGAARQEACAYSEANETAASKRQQQRKTNDFRKRDNRRAHPAIELFQASHVQRSRRHGVLAPRPRPIFLRHTNAATASIHSAHSPLCTAMKHAESSCFIHVTDQS